MQHGVNINKHILLLAAYVSLKKQQAKLTEEEYSEWEYVLLRTIVQILHRFITHTQCNANKNNNNPPYFANQLTNFFQVRGPQIIIRIMQLLGRCFRKRESAGYDPNHHQG